MKIRSRLIPYPEFHEDRIPPTPLLPEQRRLVAGFNEKVRSGGVAFEEASCLCGGEEFDLIASIDSFAMLQKTVLCRDCGLALCNPRMTEPEYAAFYSSDLYRTCYGGEDYVEDCRGRYDVGAVRHIFDAVRQTVPIGPGKTVMELGAGGGWNLLPFRDSGATVAGIDFSPTLVSMGCERGIPLEQGDLTRIRGVHDVIILNHVLEHLLQPLEFLRSLQEHMHADSVLYIAVPDLRDFTRKQLQNAHVWHFTPTTLAHYVHRAGFDIIASGPAETVHQFVLLHKRDAPPADASLRWNYAAMRWFFLRYALKYRLKKLLGRPEFRSN